MKQFEKRMSGKSTSKTLMKKARALNALLANKKQKAKTLKEIRAKRSSGRSFLQRKDLPTNTLYL